MIKLNLAIVNGLRREFEAFRRLPYRDRHRRQHAQRLADKAGITIEHFYKIMRKRSWRKSTLRPPEYQHDLFEEHSTSKSST